MFELLTAGFLLSFNLKLHFRLRLFCGCNVVVVQIYLPKWRSVALL